MRATRTAKASMMSDRERELTARGGLYKRKKKKCQQGPYMEEAEVGYVVYGRAAANEPTVICRSQRLVLWFSPPTMRVCVCGRQAAAFGLFFRECAMCVCARAGVETRGVVGDGEDDGEK